MDRWRVEDFRGPLASHVLSAVIDPSFDDPPLYDTPPHTYGHFRKEAISLVEPILQEEDVDEVGPSPLSHLYVTQRRLRTV